MYKLGCALTCHYRLLNSSEDVEQLLMYFIKNKSIQVIEIGFYDSDSYNLFNESYLMSEALLLAEKNKKEINLHLLRKNWDIMGIERVVRDIKILENRIKIKYIIIHEDDYKKYAKFLIPSHSNILVENTSGLFDLKIDNIVCDINHFYSDDLFKTRDFSKFIKSNSAKIKEFHFAYKNHNIFNQRNIHWFKHRFENIRSVLPPSSVGFIFEGTDKKAESISELITSLNLNIQLLTGV